MIELDEDDEYNDYEEEGGQELIPNNSGKLILALVKEADCASHAVINEVQKLAGEQITTFFDYCIPIDSNDILTLIDMARINYINAIRHQR